MDSFDRAYARILADNGFGPRPSSGRRRMPRRPAQVWHPARWPSARAALIRERAALNAARMAAVHAAAVRRVAPGF